MRNSKSIEKFLSLSLSLSLKVRPSPNFVKPSNNKHSSFLTQVGLIKLDFEPVWIGVFLEKNAQFDTKRNIHNRLEKLFQLNHVYKSHKSAVSKKQYLISFSISSTLNVFAPLFFSFKKPKIPPNSWLYYLFFFFSFNSHSSPISLNNLYFVEFRPIYQFRTVLKRTYLFYILNDFC